MKVSKRINTPIPNGMQIFDEGDIAGVHFRKPHAIKFICGKAHSLELIREPHNRHDPNAIKVMGSIKGFFGRKQLFIGYVPADISKKIAMTNVFGILSPRLRYLRLDGDYITISFEILGPKSSINSYQPKPQGENKKVKQIKKKSPSDIIFNDIYEFIDDSHSDYDCKKVSKALFKQVFPEFLAIALTKFNISSERLEQHEESDEILDDIQDFMIDMIDDIFDRLFELKPELEKNS